MMSQEAVQLLAVEHLQIGKVHQANGAAADFVLVGRSDAGGRVVPMAALPRRPRSRVDVELLVQRQDQRHVLSDPQIVA